MRLKPPRRPLRLAAVVLGATLVIGGSMVGAWAGFLQLSGNFHAVVEGEVYRSARLSPETLRETIRAYGIRSVISLARDDRTDPAARAVTTSEGVQRVEFGWSADKMVSPEETERFLALARDLPKPILIHCRSGADRTGLASALYLAAIKKTDEATAEAQLSFRFGHVALPVSAAWPMDLTFEREEPRLGFSGS